MNYHIIFSPALVLVLLKIVSFITNYYLLYTNHLSFRCWFPRSGNSFLQLPVEATKKTRKIAWNFLDWPMPVNQLNHWVNMFGF